MSKQLVQLCLPGPAASVHATFVDPDACSLAGLVEQILAEDAPQIVRTVCGRSFTSTPPLELWRVQRVLKSPPNCERTDEELADLDNGAHCL